MSIFWTIVLVGCGIFLYSKFKKNNELSVFENNRDLIEKWVTNKNGDFDNFYYKIYQNDALMVNSGSTIFVGFFQRNEGDACGYYFELRNGEIILEKLYFPSGITSWHSTRTREALLHNATLFELLNIAEEKHHEKFPEWKGRR